MKHLFDFLRELAAVAFVVAIVLSLVGAVVFCVISFCVGVTTLLGLR